MVVADIDRRNVNVEDEEYDMFAEEDTGGQTLQGPRSFQPGPSTSRYRGVSNDYSQPCIKVTQPVLTNQSLAYTSSISRPHDKIWPRQIIPTEVIPEDDIAGDEEEIVSETAVISEDNIARDEEEYPLPVINMATTEEVPGISTGGTVEAVEDTMGAEETEDNGGQTPRGPRSTQPVNVSREGDVQIAGVSDPTPPGHLPTVQFGSTDIRYRENHQNNDPHAIDGRLEQMTRQYTV